MKITCKVEDKLSFTPFLIQICFEKEKDLEDWEDGLSEILSYIDINPISCERYRNPVNKISQLVKYRK